MDEQQLTREMDKVKAKVFMGTNAAFLGPLMCGVEVIWDSEIPTAQTDGISMWWNPEWFLSLPFATRVTVFNHEIWHPARLHSLRRGSRDPLIWNYACDIRINNDLIEEGFSFKDIEWGWMRPEIDQGPEGRLSEEQIYEILIQEAQTPPPQPGGVGDMVEPTQEQIHTMVNNAVRAMHQANAAGAGKMPGDVKLIIEKFLTPVIPWEVVLMKWFTDKLDESYTWARPNRRYPDMYLPSTFTDDGRLAHLMFFEDISGSVSDRDILRFNSEVKYVKEVLQPEKLSLVTFTTDIKDEFVFEESDPFKKIVVNGRGGTSFECVREHINKHKPTAAIIFSDMDCSPMQPLDYPIPVLWIGVNARVKTVPFGEIIHIRN